MPNSFDLYNKVRIANPSANVDYYYGTYASVEAACEAVPRSVRMRGRTVGIVINGSVVEYWWKSGIEDANLVEKASGGSGGSGKKYVCTFDNAAGLSSVTIPASAHNCGTELMVQSKVNGNLINIDTEVSVNGNVVLRWGDPTLINQANPLKVSIIGMEVGNVPLP